MNRITIFVACHKPCDIYTDEMYRPIHVGRAISSCSEQMDMIGDDTGDNISEKNPFYSELTAQYWAWKNYHDSDYIGFCHYRRYFAKGLTASQIEEMFHKGTDVIVVGPCFRRYNRWNFLKDYVCSEDLAIMQMVIKKLYPEYYKVMSQYAYDYIDYPLNMFICKRELFDEYAKWLFSILFECEKYVKLSPYSRARRLYGYLSEFLMPVFFIKNKLNITAVPYYRSDNMKVKIYTFKQKILHRILKTIYYKDLSEVLKSDQSILLGLKNDGIAII